MRDRGEERHEQLLVSIYRHAPRWAHCGTHVSTGHIRSIMSSNLLMLIEDIKRLDGATDHRVGIMYRDEARIACKRSRSWSAPDYYSAEKRHLRLQRLFFNPGHRSSTMAREAVPSGQATLYQLQQPEKLHKVLEHDSPDDCLSCRLTGQLLALKVNTPHV